MLSNINLTAKTSCDQNIYITKNICWLNKMDDNFENKEFE